MDILAFFSSLKSSSMHVWCLEAKDDGCQKREVEEKGIQVGFELGVLGVNSNRFLMEAGFLIFFFWEMNFPRKFFMEIWMPKVKVPFPWKFTSHGS